MYKGKDIEVNLSTLERAKVRREEAFWGMVVVVVVRGGGGGGRGC